MFGKAPHFYQFLIVKRREHKMSDVIAHTEHTLVLYIIGKTIKII